MLLTMRNFLLRSFSACLTIPALFIFAIRLPAQTIKLPAISFTGAPAYSQADLLKLSGLHAGDITTAAAIQAAAQRINDTGLFSDIRYQSGASGLVFALKPMPASQLVPARFINFVWWTPVELATELKARVPLYTGLVPLSGNTQDAITAALKALVAEKGVTANITATPDAQLGGGTATSVSFAIDTPQVLIHSLTFSQASPAMQPKLEAIIKHETGQPFAESETRNNISDQLITIYRNGGYLDAALTNLTFPQPAVTANAINLDLTAAISEGEPYRLSSLTWPGSELMSTADFNKYAVLKPEAIASQNALKESLAPLAHAYYVKGFQDAKVQAAAAFDRATHHVSYSVSVVPGEQYRFHGIKVIGLTPEQQKQFDSAWKMHPGDFYDVTYLTGFLKSHPELTALRGYSAAYKAYSDTNTHLVDLVLTFKQGGTLVDVNAN